MSVTDRTATRLEETTVSAHLATTADDRPHVAPVWFLYDDDHLYTFTGGQKLSNIRKNPRVAVSIEDEGWHAVIQGTAVTVEDDDRIREVGQQLFEKYTGGHPSDAYTDSDGTPHGTLVEIDIGTVTVRDN